MYDAALLDLYGTLVDIRTDESDPALWRALAAIYAERGAVWTAAELQTAYRLEVRRLEAESAATCPEIEIDRVFFALYRQKGVAADDETVAKTAWRFRQLSTKHIRLYAGAPELLAALQKRGRVILLSNAQRLFTVPELKMLDLWDRFDAVFLSSDYGCKKPDPAFFRVPLDAFGLDPKRCLMIGNDPFADAAGARAVGMDALCIRSATSPREAERTAYDLHHMDLRRVRRMLCGR